MIAVRLRRLSRLQDPPTEPIHRVPTLPMETVTRENGPPHCPRCGRETEFLSAGHYQNGCLLTMQDSEYHFCCPGQCELNTA